MLRNAKIAADVRRVSELVTRVRADQVASRKAGDKDRTLVLGTVLAAFKYQEIELGRDQTDADAVDVLRKQIKQRRDSVEQYTKAARPELVAKEEFEIGVLASYLPPEVDPEVLRAAAREMIAGGASDIGKLMGAMMARFKGQADGKMINQIARESLQQK